MKINVMITKYNYKNVSKYLDKIYLKQLFKIMFFALYVLNLI